jgi:hypothetical protein
MMFDIVELQIRDRERESEEETRGIKKRSSNFE